jgi:hypothetical protein
MNYKEIIKGDLFKAVDNQLAKNDPPETMITFLRLKKDGFSEIDCKQMIAQCIVIEMFGTIKDQQPFNHERFVQNLNKLPNDPFD